MQKNKNILQEQNKVNDTLNEPHKVFTAIHSSNLGNLYGSDNA